MNNKYVPIEQTTDKLVFGKYRNKTIQQVIDYDPEYILWLDQDRVIRINPKIISLAIQTSGGKSKPRKYSPAKD